MVSRLWARSRAAYISGNTTTAVHLTTIAAATAGTTHSFRLHFHTDAFSPRIVLALEPDDADIATATQLRSCSHRPQDTTTPSGTTSHPQKVNSGSPQNTPGNRVDQCPIRTKADLRRCPRWPPRHACSCQCGARDLRPSRISRISFPSPMCHHLRPSQASPSSRAYSSSRPSPWRPSASFPQPTRCCRPLLSALKRTRRWPPQRTRPPQIR